MENHHVERVHPLFHTISMAVFNSYLSLPEGILTKKDGKVQSQQDTMINDSSILLEVTTQDLESLHNYK